MPIAKRAATQSKDPDAPGLLIESFKAFVLRPMKSTVRIPGPSIEARALPGSFDSARFRFANSRCAQDDSFTTDDSFITMVKGRTQHDNLFSLDQRNCANCFFTSLASP